MSASAPDPALRRALLAARDKREARGASGDGRILLAGLQPEEALALDGLLAPRKTILAGATLRVALSSFEAALRDVGIDPREAYESVGESPLRDLPAERAAIRDNRTTFRAWLAGHDVARGRPAIGAWLDDAERQGRIGPGNRDLVDRALRVVAELPAAAPLQRTVVAARLLDGDPHGLDPDTPLHTIVVALLATDAGIAPRPPRGVWEAFGVLVDPVSSTVAVLNLPATGEHPLAAALLLMHGHHVVLTYGQLAWAGLRWPPGVVCHSCENPSVLIAAEQALGADCPPLLCTGGRPSDAVRLLLASLHAAGARIRHHGDADVAGEQILADLQERYGAERWTCDAPGAGGAEELVIDALVVDLGRGRD